MIRLIGSIIFINIFITLLMGCGGSSKSNSSNTNNDGNNNTKTIKGVALKNDGSVFTNAATVIAVDQNGNIYKGSVDSNGTYSVTLSEANSTTNNNLIQNITFIRIYDNDSAFDLVVSEDQVFVNANLITSAASMLAMDYWDLNSIFEEAADVISSNKSHKAISNSSILEKLLHVRPFSEELFKANVSVVIGSTFGFGENGKDLIDIDKFISGNSNEKELMLLIAAVNYKKSLGFSSPIYNVNEPTHASNQDFLLNESKFFEYLALELAAQSEPANESIYSDYLNAVITDSSVKIALNTIKDELNALVIALKEDSTATLDESVIGTIVSERSQAFLAIERVDDILIFFERSGFEDGDSTSITISVFTQNQYSISKKIMELKIDFLIEDSKLVPSSGEIAFKTSDIELKINDTKSFNDGAFDLAVVLSEAKTVLEEQNQSTSAAEILSSVDGYALVVQGTPINRSDKNSVSFFLDNVSVFERFNSITGLLIMSDSQ